MRLQTTFLSCSFFKDSNLEKKYQQLSQQEEIFELGKSFFYLDEKDLYHFKYEWCSLVDKSEHTTYSGVSLPKYGIVLKGWNISGGERQSINNCLVMCALANASHSNIEIECVFQIDEQKVIMKQ